MSTPNSQYFMTYTHSKLCAGGWDGVKGTFPCIWCEAGVVLDDVAQNGCTIVTHWLPLYTGIPDIAGYFQQVGWVRHIWGSNVTKDLEKNKNFQITSHLI